MYSIRQTIGGQTYDTSESEFVGSATVYDDDDLTSDVALYRTVNDTWFLGVTSDSFGRGSITPLTTAQARRWCETHDVDPVLVRFHFEPRRPVANDPAGVPT